MRLNKTERGPIGLIFLAWAVYATSYLGKVSYSANITQIIEFYSVTKAEAGLVPTLLFFAYGLGQVVNGIFCKRYNIKWVIFAGLASSGLMNLAVACTTDFSVVKWLWLANGFFLSMLWPTLVRLLSETLPQKYLGISSVVMGTTIACGTLTIYALSSVFVAFDRFKLAFYTAAFVALAVSAVWLLSFDKAVSKTKAYAEKEDRCVAQAKPTEQGTGRQSVLATIGVLCVCAIGINLIKDGLTTWIPSVLKEEGSVSDSLSILLTLFLPIVAIFGNALALRVHNKLPNYVMHCLVMFALMAVLIGGVIGILPLGMAWAMLLGLVIVNLLASGLNSLLTSIFPMFMRDTVDSGKTAGILNGFCYLGSTVSSYGLGVVADRFGWGAAFWCLLGACVFISLVCLAYLILAHSKNGL